MARAVEPAGATLSAAAAKRLARDALLATGATEDTATCVASHTVEAERAGHPSHGLRLIPGYCDRAHEHGFRLDVEPQLAERSAALARIDACGGIGYRALELAVDAAATGALRHGIAACAVVQCGHAGRAGAWVERGVKHGAVTIVLLGGSDPPFMMAAGPGAVAALHTNPLAIGVPAHGPPLVLDIATSVVAEGKVAVAHSRGTALPEGAILSSGDAVSTDPADFYEGGSLLPVGGHKGFGLSVVVEALAVLLTGADAANARPHEGALVICISADGFRSAGDLATAVESLRQRLHSSGRKRPVLAPGEPEAAARRRRKVRIETALHDDLVARSTSARRR